MNQLTKDIIKVKKVIDSCVTLEQLETAKNMYCVLVEKYDKLYNIFLHKRQLKQLGKYHITTQLQFELSDRLNKKKLQLNVK